MEGGRRSDPVGGRLRTGARCAQFGTPGREQELDDISERTGGPAERRPDAVGAVLRPAAGGDSAAAAAVGTTDGRAAEAAVRPADGRAARAAAAVGPTDR